MVQVDRLCNFFKEEIIADTLFVTPYEGANRVERVVEVDRSRKPVDNFDRAGGDSFADYLARATETRKKETEEATQFKDELIHMKGMSYYNRHAMMAYFSMSDSKTNFTC